MWSFLRRLFRRGKSAAVGPGTALTAALAGQDRAEARVRMGEERFRLMVESVRDYAIFMLDPTGRVASWNIGAERLKGYKAEEIIGRHFSTFYPQDAKDRGWPEEELRRAAEDGRIEDEGWRIRKDGTRFWANVVITAFRDQSGVLRGFAKVTRDMTERREAEENARRLLQAEAARKAAEEWGREIERQREQLRVTLASIGDAVVVTDDQGRVTFLNSVAAGLTGWELPEAEGQPLEKIFHIINEETRQLVENPVSRVFRENRVVDLANHTALVGRAGREVPIEDTAAPIRGPGSVIYGVVLVFRDVTESRRAQEARRYLAAIVESSDDAIIGHSLDGRIASWNRGAERLYGYSAVEIIGQPLALLVPLDHPDETNHLIECVSRGDYIDHFETQRVHKDGRRVEVSLTISPVRNAAGKVIGISKIARDITARKEEERNKNEFLALLAHELRNPLAPLRNGLQVLRLAGRDAPAAERACVMMQRQLEHLVRLVDDLLDVSRISRSKLTLHKELTVLQDVVNHALEVCDSLARDRDDEFAVTLPDEPLYVDADRTRLAQALCNLLNNAVKFSDRGSRVLITMERAGDQAVIHVKDPGVGIPDYGLTKVFDLFWQVDRSLEKSHGGLGVGLAIVKRLVEMHGGTVEAHSEGHGEGSEFVVRLPVAAPASSPSPGGHRDAPLSSPPGSRRILVADDNADAAESLAMLLNLLGQEVRVARDGEEAVEAVASHRPELIFLDIGMPKLNGYDACRRIRELPGGRDIRIFALTGWGQDEDKRRSKAAGFDGHLVKPVEPSALNELLAENKAQKTQADK